MKEKLRDAAGRAGITVQAFVRWCLFALIVGVVVGLAGAGFHSLLVWVGKTRVEHDWLIFLLPLVGPVICFLYRKGDLPLERGTNFILTSVREDHPVRLRLAPLIVLGTALTHLTGGSAGREGAALQLGGALSGNIGRFVRLDEYDRRTITMCGMAACFTALFGTPLAATVFAIEVISVGVMYYAALLPCLLSSLIAYTVALRLGCEPTRFSLMNVPDGISPALLAQVLALGVLCALVAILVCVTFHMVHKLSRRYVENPYLRIVLGGVIVVALSLLLGTRDYNGTGMDVIARALNEGQARPEAFVCKLVLTAITLGVGYKGGEIVPVFFVGATFGCVFGGFLGLPASFAAGLGLTAVFCGVTNSPLTSILLAYELFGGAGLPLFALAIAVSYMLSGYFGLYSEQKIMYSKLRPQFIDRKTK